MLAALKVLIVSIIFNYIYLYINLKIKRTGPAVIIDVHIVGDVTLLTLIDHRASVLKLAARLVVTLVLERYPIFRAVLRHQFRAVGGIGRAATGAWCAVHTIFGVGYVDNTSHTRKTNHI